MEKLGRIAFQCNPEIASRWSCVVESMNKVCTHRKALKFVDEPPGMRCSNGKVKLPVLNAPPEPWFTLGFTYNTTIETFFH